jgi:AcrR family transcriptional regulator
MASRVTQRADAQRNRERLLAAAEAAFNAQGAGASLDDIAKAAGVGNATLYRHFPTRAKLLEAVYDQRIADLCAAAAELAQPAAPAWALHEWLRAVVAHVTDRRVLTDAFLATYEGPADIEPPQFAAWHNALFDAGRPLLAAAQDAGTARRDVDIAELLALVTGVARAGSPAQAERFLSVLLEGITPRLRRRSGSSVLAAGSDEAGFVGQHDGLDAVAEAEFGQYPPDMDLDGAFGQVQLGGDLTV